MDDVWRCWSAKTPFFSSFKITFSKLGWKKLKKTPSLTQPPWSKAPLCPPKRRSRLGPCHFYGWVNLPAISINKNGWQPINSRVVQRTVKRQPKVHVLGGWFFIKRLRQARLFTAIWCLLFDPNLWGKLPSLCPRDVPRKLGSLGPSRGQRSKKKKKKKWRK